MKRLILSAILSLLFTLPVYWLAQADGPFSNLQPGTRADYRFDYRGDGSQIRVALDASDASAISLGIYTPAQMEAQRRGETVSPVGRGTRNRDHDLFWAGGFPAPGVYHVFVESRANVPILYRLDISGEGVSSAAPVTTVVAPTAGKTITDGGRSTLVVTLPENSGIGILRLAIPKAPATCTHAAQIPAVIAQSIKLCPNENYPALRVLGNNIGIFADDPHSAVVNSNGRQFAVTVEGTNNWIEGITIQARADPQDAVGWLCLYDECSFPTRPMTTTLTGGTRYGGGILLKGSNSTVHGVTVRGGIIGIAMVDGRRNYLIDNQLNELGWGSFNVNVNGSFFVGNVINKNNRACTTPDGRKFLHGCETSGWVCLNCQQNIVASNHCELSANCFYLSGERGLASNDNKFVSNYCSGASDNCFELTFSQRNLLQDNVATVDPKTDVPCKYPFWVGGSIVYFKNNRWQCAIDPDDAFNQARDSTIVATNIINLDAPGIPPSLLLPPASPTLARRQTATATPAARVPAETLGTAGGTIGTAQ